eukprot:EG_transcript_1110
METKGSSLKSHFPTNLLLDSGSEELLHTLIRRRLPFVILDTRTADTIVFASDAFLSTTEYPAAEVIGQSCAFLQGPERRPDTCQRMRQAFQCGQAMEEAIQFCTKSGQRYSCSLSLSPIKHQEQPITHYLAVQKHIIMADCYVRSDSSEGLSDVGENFCESRSPCSVQSGAHYFKPKPPVLTPSHQRRMPRQPFSKPHPPLFPKPLLADGAEPAEAQELPTQRPARPTVDGAVAGGCGEPSSSPPHDLKAMEKELREKEQALCALRDTMEQRRQFMNYIFHEVRQPFSVLMLGLQHVAASCQSVLEQLASSGNQHLVPAVDGILDTAKELTEASESMHRILNDFLMMEKLQEGKLAVESAFHDVQDIITSARKQTACLFNEKQIAVHVTVDEELRGMQAAYDKCRLQQVMLNLLTNAAKFTPQGGDVHLHMECTQPPTETAVDVEVRVADSGVGIPDAVQRQLFQPFVQFRAGELQGGGGTGLGLAITKGLIEAHGGSLGVRSTVGHGAEFWFRLKLERSPASPPVLDRPSSLNLDDVSTASFSSVPDSSTADVLVVDDQPLFQKYMQASLRRMALRVALAASAEEVLERYAQGERWRLIFSDCTMGVTSGPAMTQALLAMGCASPIIGVSGDAGNVEEFLAAGACHVCTKPVKQEDLQQCIALFLQPTGDQ